MDHIWIIEINLFCTLILGIILYSLFKNYDRQTKQRCYMNALRMGIASCLADVNWALIEGKLIYEPRFCNFLTNAVYYLASIMTAYYWLNYVELSLDSKIIKNKKIKFLTKIPVIIVVVGVLVSYFNGFFFYIDENNVYQRGKYVMLHTGLCHMYTFLTSLHAFIKSLKTKVYIKAVEYRILAMFLIFPLIVGLIQIFVPNIPTVNAGITLAFLFVYVDLQNLLISIDTLTGLNNRNQLMKYLGSRIRNEAENVNLYVFMMDVNKFKKINDSYGHVEGDAALIRCAQALKKANKHRNNFIGRYGGDEFIVIADLKTQEEVDEICSKMKGELAKICEAENVPYDLSFSIGYAKFDKSYNSIQNFIAAADQKLYEEKKNRA